MTDAEWWSVCDRLAKIVDYYKWSDDEVGHRAGLSRQAVGKALGGKSGVKTRLKLRVAKFVRAVELDHAAVNADYGG